MQKRTPRSIPMVFAIALFSLALAFAVDAITIFARFHTPGAFAGGWVVNALDIGIEPILYFFLVALLTDALVVSIVFSVVYFTVRHFRQNL